MKTYAAQSGYVYHYYYMGQRAAPAADAPGVEFVFDVSADRKSFIPVSVIVPAASLEAWEARQGRMLIAREIYAVAKLALFQAFDERPDPAAMNAAVRVRTADAEAILEQLDL